MRQQLAALALVGLALSSLAGCSSFFEPEVVRKVHGKPVAGRFVSDEAYAAYLEGSVADEEGKPAEAEQAFERALRLDDRGADAWSRLGRLRCQRGDPAADQAFARAAALDPSFGPLLRERARCELRRGRLDQALADALAAVDSDPSDTSGSLLVAEIDEKRGDLDAASRWLEGLWARSPHSHEALAALARFARAHDRPSLLARVREAQRSLDDRREKSLALPPAASLDPAGLARVDEALARGDLDEARLRAIHHRLPPGELALRAVAMGNPPLALAQARLVLAADPSSADARVALLAAADLSGDGASFDRGLALLPPASTPPSPLARLLLAELLLRRAGPDPARASLPAAGPPGDDPLALRIRQRLETALALPKP